MMPPLAQLTAGQPSLLAAGADPAQEGEAAKHDLTMLKAEFPAFQIWREDLHGRARYVARSLHSGLNPHTVVTSDLAELRDALEPAKTAGMVPFTAARPNIARMYSYLLRGKDHYQADRTAADAVVDRFPEVAEIARANRRFLARAVRHVARQGVTQFLDLGAGLPASPNIHEVAGGVAAGARTCYVDNDPVVLAHTQAALADDDRVRVAAGDIRDPGAVLTDPVVMDLIDAAAPVCVLLVSVLHFLPAGEADVVVAAFKQWMTPGSYLVISAGTSTGTDPELVRSLQAAYADTAPVTGRSAEEIAAWFDGFCLARPGLTDVRAWRAEGPSGTLGRRARFLAGVARKPAGGPVWQP
jgi:O-methyltransferase involved in polyketide biosynthesis